MDKDKVIQFTPKEGNNPFKPPASKAEVDEITTTVKEYHIQETLSLMIPLIFEQLALLGFNGADESLAKDSVFIGESIRSFMNRRYNIPHIFHPLVDKYVEKTEDDYQLIKVDDGNN